MPIRFPCSACQRSLSIGSRKAGTRVQCPACQATVAVPEPNIQFTAQRLQTTAPSPATWPTSPSQPALPPRRWRNGPRILAVVGALSLLVLADLVASRFWMNRGKPHAVQPASPPGLGSLLDGPDEIQPANSLLLVAEVNPTPPAEEAFVGPPAPAPEESPALVTEVGTHLVAAAEETLNALKETPPPPRLVIKRRHNYSAEELRKQLLDVPELKLVHHLHDLQNVIHPKSMAQREVPRSPLAPTLLAQKSDLEGLPMRMGHDCQLGKEPAENLQALSRKLRAHVTASISEPAVDPRPDPVRLRRVLLESAERGQWLQPEAIPALAQILQAENTPLRLLLVDALAAIEGPAATQALAQRALFDLAPEVRAAAVQALSERPRDEFRSLLLAGFRYPWQPVGDHAAEALVALRDRDAVPELVRLVQEPSAPAPRDKPAPTMVRELVRVNHLSNCMLCHARSSSANDLVRGLVPSPSQPLPPPTTPYYGGNQGMFVRADVTYLKQDFSVPQPVERPGPWPSMQRYDYLVRARPATALDGPEKTTSKPHPALFFALGELDARWHNLLAQQPARAEP